MAREYTAAGRAYPGTAAATSRAAALDGELAGFEERQQLFVSTVTAQQARQAEFTDQQESAGAGVEQAGDGRAVNDTAPRQPRSAQRLHYLTREREALQKGIAALLLAHGHGLPVETDAEVADLERQIRLIDEEIAPLQRADLNAEG
jgi:hypothetical protein